MPINEKIRADEVMLIDDSGEKLGIVMIGEALDKAKAKNIDLVHHSDLPAMSGLGSSSSFTVGLTNCLNIFKASLNCLFL